MNRMKKINGILIGVSIVFVLLIPLILSYSMRNITIWGILVIYSGAIIGGLITLFGVTYSLKQSEKAKSKELELLYRPIVKGEKGKTEEKDKEIIITCNNESYDDKKQIHGKSSLILKNVGRGEMRQVRIRNIKVDSVAGVIPYAEGNLSEKEEIDIIGVEDTLTISISTPKNKVNDEVSTIYNVSFILEYKGILNQISFQNKVSFTYSINNKEKNELSNIKVRTI